MTRTAFVATYPPRRCGIATFTADLGRATGDREIVALHPSTETLRYPSEVHHRIDRDVPADYMRVARALGGCVDVVSVQHEYGIWGGEDGSAVLDFVRALDVPVVATLHTVLRDPTPNQRAILAELVRSVGATVVMSRSAATLLTDAYGVDPTKLDVIPHGVPDLPIVDAASIKPALGLAGRDVILSFGLLGPGKGYELAIDALPALVARHPTVCYVIVGATHPDLVRRDGEAYRTSLTERVERLGMADARPVRGPLRQPPRADPLARVRRRVRDPVSQHGPDRVRDDVLRDERGPGHRLHPLHVCRGAVGQRPGRPGAAGFAGRACRGARRAALG